MDVLLSSTDIFDRPSHSAKPYLPFKRCGISELEDIDMDHGDGGGSSAPVPGGGAVWVLSLFRIPRIEEMLREFSRRRPYVLPMVCCVFILALSVFVVAAVYMNVMALGVTVPGVDEADLDKPPLPPDDDDDLPITDDDTLQQPYPTVMYIVAGLFVVGILVTVCLLLKFKTRYCGFTAEDARRIYESAEDSQNDETLLSALSANEILERLEKFDTKKRQEFRKTHEDTLKTCFKKLSDVEFKVIHPLPDKLTTLGEFNLIVDEDFAPKKGIYINKDSPADLQLIPNGKLVKTEATDEAAKTCLLNILFKARAYEILPHISSSSAVVHRLE